MVVASLNSFSVLLTVDFACEEKQAQGHLQFIE